MTNRYCSFEATVAAYGTDTFTFTANQHDIDLVSEEITPDRGNIFPITNKGRTPRTRLIGPLSWTGSIETLMYTKHVPSLFYYAMGTAATVADMPTMGVNTHTITPGNTIIPFIMAIGRDVNEHQYTNCVLDGFSIDFAPADPMSVSFDVNCRKELTQAALSSVTLDDFNAAERTFSGVEVAVAMGAAEGGSPTTDTTVESANISYTNNFEGDAYVVGDQYLSGNFVNQQEVTGSMEFSFLTITDYQDVVGDVDKEVWFTTTQGAGAAERGYVVKLPRISYNTTSIPTNNAERFVQSVDFTATGDATDDNIIVENIGVETNAELIA
jgi:hypothetical protein